MSTVKAMTEARKRWGETAAIQQSRRSGKCTVGQVFPNPVFGRMFVIRGDGPTWEAALAKADAEPK